MTSEARKRAQTVVIRKAQDVDLPACAMIVNRWIDETDWMPRVHAPDVIAAHFVPEALTGRTIWLAEVGGEPAGYMSLSDEGFVRGFYLGDAFRGHGIGKMLMDNAKALFPAGLSLTAYVPNLAGRAFYAREGFVEDASGAAPATDEGPATVLLHWRPRA